jgi:hypothetical protein
LSSQAKETWWTPQVQDSKHSGTNPTANGERDLLVNQVNWATASVPNVAKTWATPCSRDHHPNGQADGSKTDLGNQVTQWGTPTARDHKSGRGNNEREYKELTPMVERAQAGKLNQNWVCCLMGVPMGWVDPLCPVSVIKNWPRFVTGWVRPQTAQIPCDYSATELSQSPQSEPSEFSLAS